MEKAVSQLHTQDPEYQQNVKTIFFNYIDQLYRRTDRLFLWILLFQWMLEIIFSVWVTPKTWIGSTSMVHIHVWAAIFLGGGIIVLPCLLIWKRPGQVETRHAIAIAQALTSVLLIHLSGGRLETHFHIFGSLAFLAMYRDWRVIVTTTAIVALDHLIRGYYWPESVYGTVIGTDWRWLEHVAWVVFEDIFLIESCKSTHRTMLSNSEKQAQVLQLNSKLDKQIVQRTEQLTLLQAELVQADKMASLGQLAAGVAHEINNPVSFVTSNLNTLTKYTATIKRLFQEYRNLVAEIEDTNSQQSLTGQIRALESEAKLSFIMEDIDNLLIESKDGTNRVKEIVKNLKTFVRLDEAELKEANLNECLESTLKIAWNELKYKCNVIKDFADIPNLYCNAGQLNQVFLNLFVNAAQAIAEQGDITVCTAAVDKHIIVQISDTGSGMTKEVMSQIFNPFYTTKPVGQGTGLGLSISYGIIQNHQGIIEVDSEVGKGTTFTIKLPMQAINSV